MQISKLCNYFSIFVIELIEISKLHYNNAVGVFFFQMFVSVVGRKRRKVVFFIINQHLLIGFCNLFCVRCCNTVIFQFMVDCIIDNFIINNIFRFGKNLFSLFDNSRQVIFLLLLFNIRNIQVWYSSFNYKSDTL